MKLTIGSKSIKMKDGLYCLNDLHKASGGEKKNGPSYFISLDSTANLTNEIMESDTEISVSYIINLT
ncbi:MAG: KilA-N domain-containing protein [Aliivibrio sp.]|nr:KilA-N domain-containing protein [Aliivibrio sp.]